MKNMQVELKDVSGVTLPKGLRPRSEWSKALAAWAACPTIEYTGNN